MGGRAAQNGADDEKPKGQVMGFDILGNQPKNQPGAEFLVGSFWWHILAEVVQHFAPEIAKRCRSHEHIYRGLSHPFDEDEAPAERAKHWHYNDWYGLDGESARELGRVLRARIDDCAIYELVGVLLNPHDIAATEEGWTEREFAEGLIKQIEGFITFLNASDGFVIG
jgi:hypothetical protein